jgi:hypothetical protein
VGVAVGAAVGPAVGVAVGAAVGPAVGQESDLMTPHEGIEQKKALQTLTSRPRHQPRSPTFESDAAGLFSAAFLGDEGGVLQSGPGGVLPEDGSRQRGLTSYWHTTGTRLADSCQTHGRLMSDSWQN